MVDWNAELELLKREQREIEQKIATHRQSAHRLFAGGKNPEFLERMIEIRFRQLERTRDHIRHIQDRLAKAAGPSRRGELALHWADFVREKLGSRKVTR